MKNLFPFLIIIITLVCCQEVSTESNKVQLPFTNEETSTPCSPFDSKHDTCEVLNIETKLQQVYDAKLITVEEVDLPAKWDSINELVDYELNIFLDSADDSSTFDLLSKLANPLKIRLNFSLSKSPRTGISKLKNTDFLELDGATPQHIKQLCNLTSLKFLHLEIVRFDSFPNIFDQCMHLQYLNLTLCKFKHFPDEFTHQTCLQRLDLTKTSMEVLPINKELLSLKAINAGYSFGFPISSSWDSLPNLERIFLTNEVLSKNAGVQLQNFKVKSSNYQGSLFERK